MKHLLKAIQAAEDELLVGNIILYPTDTVWGIGCDAENAQAVKKIYQIKERQESKSMIILVSDVDMLRNYVKDVPADFDRRLAMQQKPTTYVFSEAQNLPEALVAADGSIAVRVVNEDFCHRLIRQIGRPLVSTSANISGEPAPASFSEISEEIKQRVDHVVQWRQDEEIKAQPSRIVKIEADGTHRVLRE